MSVIQMKKDITFIYMDSAEKAIYTPIAEEAKRRGYTVTMTEDKFARCEIGFYCQHVNFPQYSKFSVVMLHDIIQQYSNWPDLWYREPWNKYDVGILPSNLWESNWKASSHNFYAHPKKGIYKIGWPKADTVAALDREAYKAQFQQEQGLDPNKKTILYAPSWENDGKQDDFVQAMLQLDVNILIKQAAVTVDKFPDMYYAIQEMNALHKDNPRVKILDPSLNIFNAILASDVLVSEESSTMCEAMMMGIPSVSVSDWLIPDTTPSRYPECNYDFVIMTKKAGLTDCVRDLIDNYEEHQKTAQRYRDETFPNIGKASTMIMDIIDDCVAGKPIRHPAITPAPKKALPAKKYIKHKLFQCKQEVYYNYCVQSSVVNGLWQTAKKAKNLLKGK